MRRFASVGVVSAFLLVAVFGLLVPSKVAAPTTVLVSEDFEGAWPGSWTVRDQNGYNALDYWGVSGYKAFEGTKSAWAAQVGFNDALGSPNDVVHQYDNGMEAWMEIGFPNPGGYERIQLSFRYWLESEWCCDWLAVSQYVGAPAGYWYTVWTTRGDSFGWAGDTFVLSPDASRVAFVFITDGSATYEGAYVDDVEITAEAGPPESQVEFLPSYQRTTSFLIDFSAWDNGSGVDYVELNFRKDGGPWTKYAPSWNPSGRWRWSPISFEGSGEGVYDFYTNATDNAGNVEASPPAPDATTTVDMHAPTSSVTALPTYRSNRAMTLTIDANDAFGIASIQVYARVNLGEWTTLAVLNAPPWRLTTFASEDGLYEFFSVATDHARNTEEMTGVADAQVFVDSDTPDLEIATPQPDGRYASREVLVAWDGSDVGSGIDRYEVRVDGGAWTDVGAETSTVLSLSDGHHAISVRAHDRAGNVRLRAVEITVDSNASLTPASTYAGLTVFLLIAVLLVALLLLFTMRRRRRPVASDMPPASPPSPPPESPP